MCAFIWWQQSLTEIRLVGPGRVIQPEINSYNNLTIITQPTEGQGNMHTGCYPIRRWLPRFRSTRGADRIGAKQGFPMPAGHRQELAQQR